MRSTRWLPFVSLGVLASALSGCPPSAEVKPPPAPAIVQPITPPAPPAPAIVHGDLPAAAQHLSAEYTIGFVAIERLDSLARLMLDPKKPTARTRKRGRPRTFIEKLRSFKDFDPTIAESWRSIGFDPTVGAGFAFDVRVSGPLLFAQITDRAAAIAALARLGLHIEVGIEADGITSLRVDHEPMLLGQRDGLTFVLAGLDAEAQRDAFAHVLKPDAPIAGLDRFIRAFGDGQRAPWLSAYVDTPATVPMGAEVEGLFKFYTDRFAQIAITVSADQTSLRVMADASARSALGDVFRVDAAVPDFARHIAGDDGVLRADLNLSRVLDGLTALLPASARGARAGLARLPDHVQAASGASLPQLAAALTGHFALDGQWDGDRLPVLLAGVKDAQAVDAMLPLIGKRLRSLGARVALDAIDDRDTYLVDFTEDSPFAKATGATAFAMARTDSILAIGALPQVRAAFAQTTSGLPSRAASLVNAAHPLLVLGQPQPASESASPLMTRFLTPRMVDGFVFGDLTLDDRGLRMSGDATVTAAGGILAAVAVPAFMKYVRRSKTNEALTGTAALAAASGRAANAATARGERARFPASAPLTPKTPACKDGQRRRHVPDAKTWSHPTWRALGFSVREPFLYQYEYVSDGASFTARAIGDLDCDGVTATFERTGRIDADGILRLAEDPVSVEPLE